MSRGASARQVGASLVEIMVALVLGLMLAAGLFQIYLSSKASYRLQDALAQRQENLRYVTRLLTRDLRMVGYRGCLRDIGQVNSTLNSPNDFLYNFGLHIQGFEATSTTAWSPALHASLTPVVGGTDVLTLRSATGTLGVLTQAMPTTAAAMRAHEVETSPAFAIGDIVMVTDCGGSDIFQITGYNPPDPPPNPPGQPDATLVHNPGSGGALPTPGNATQNLSRRYLPGAELVRLSTVSYFVRESVNGTGPALWRRAGLDAAAELVEGIENLQVQFGEDTDADAVPDFYRNASAIANWANVTAVRVALLAVGVGETQATQSDPRQYALLDRTVGPFDDRRLRRVVTVTISLRNRLP